MLMGILLTTPLRIACSFLSTPTPAISTARFPQGDICVLPPLTLTHNALCTSPFTYSANDLKNTVTC